LDFYTGPKLAGPAMLSHSIVYGATWRKVRLEVLERDGWLCQIRGPRCKIVATDADHIVSWRDGGPLFDLSNLRAACSKCNRGRDHGRRARRRRPSREW